MNEESSNPNMEQQWQLLRNIEQVEAPEHLFDRVMDAVKQPTVISMAWVPVAAAVFLCLLSLEIWMATHTTPSHQAESLELVLPVPNNMLYHD